MSVSGVVISAQKVADVTYGLAFVIPCAMVPIAPNADATKENESIL